MNREITLLIGRQGTGKTYQLERAARWYAARHSCSCVHVVDPAGEFAELDWDGLDVVIVDSSQSYHEAVYGRADSAPVDSLAELWGGGEIVVDDDSRGRIPRVVLWATTDAGGACRAAIETGSCVVILDEAYRYAPSAGSWRGVPELHDLLLRGRHLRTADGRMASTGIIAACQYPRLLHHLFADQATSVLASAVRGEQARQWIRSYAGTPALERTDRLGQHEWAVIAGRRPGWFQQ
jgi:hypothetical protein